MLPNSPNDEISSQICILGGGFAGLYTALYLSKLSWGRLKKPQITLVDQGDRFLFTPFLYELITKEFQIWEIAPPFKKLLEGTGIRFCRGTVQAVDLEKRQVYLREGETLTYDRLVLAMGAEADLSNVPGAESYTCPFRTLSDAQHLKEQLRFLEVSDRQQICIVIAGGGPSGVELAGKLVDRLGDRGRVHLVERGSHLLKAFTSFSRKTAYRSLSARGVEIRLETDIKSIEGDRVTLSHHGQIETISADLVLWTVGVQINNWLHAPACLRNPQGRLVARPSLQLVGYPDVFALGDLAAVQDASGNYVPATAQAAYQQAACAAHNTQASLLKRRLRLFRYIHLGEMLTLGTKTAIVSSFGINLSGSLATATRRLVYMLLRMPTVRHRVHVARHQLARLFLSWLPGRKRRSPAPSVSIDHLQSNRSSKQLTSINPSYPAHRKEM